jgi:hypothetical protein
VKVIQRGLIKKGEGFEESGNRGSGIGNPEDIRSYIFYPKSFVYLPNLGSPESKTKHKEKIKEKIVED